MLGRIVSSLSSLFFSTLTLCVKGVIILVPTALCLLFLYQKRLIYPSNLPAGSRDTVWTPDQFGFPTDTWRDQELTSKDGQTKLRAYIINANSAARPSNTCTLLFFHGNAGNTGHRLPIIRHLWDKLGGKCNIMMLSVRGYGKSDGSPDEAGIKLDAEAAVDYILKDSVLKHTKLFVYGQSIGGAIAFHLAATFQSQIKGLIVENTFLSLPKVIPNVMPFLKHLTFLCMEKWNTEELIPKLNLETSILFLGGTQDELVPPSHMTQLFDMWSKRRSVNDESSKSSSLLLKSISKFVAFPGGTHNDTCMQPRYFDEISDFLAAVE